MENLIKWALTRWYYYNLLRSLIGIVVNSTKLWLIKQYMWAINLVDENIIDHTALRHSTAWKPGGIWGL